MLFFSVDVCIKIIMDIHAHLARVFGDAVESDRSQVGCSIEVPWQCCERQGCVFPPFAQQESKVK